MRLEGQIKQEFDVEVTNYSKTQLMSEECLRAYAGLPDWLDEDDGIETVNFAKSICSEVARLTTLGTKVTIEGEGRGEYLQRIIDKNYYNMRRWVEYAGASGTIILKPNGTDIDAVFPGDFYITNTYNGEIWGAVFVTREQSNDGKVFYTRMEYHRFEGEGDYKQYKVSNRCYASKSAASTGDRVPIEDTPWSMLSEDVTVGNIERPLFAVLKTPHANNVDINSPLNTPIFASALQELKDLDIAYSRNAEEIQDSRRTVLLDADRLFVDGGNMRNPNTRIGSLEKTRESMGLPKFVKSVDGMGEGNIYNEINPTLNTEQRVNGINALLSQIGYKVGFSNGYFVFNERNGIQTATGVEADQQRTIQFVKDCRDQLEKAITDLVYAIDVFASLYDLSTGNQYELTLDFGDLVYNREEDKLHWLQYVQLGYVPFTYYLTKFEGMSEEDAQSLVDSAQQASLERMFQSQQIQQAGAE